MKNSTWATPPGALNCQIHICACFSTFDCSSHGARSGAQEKASWSSIVPHLGPLLSRETSSVQTSTKIVEETSKNSPQTKGRRCQDRWRDWRWSVRMSVRFWCQGRTDGSAKRLWLFDSSESVVHALGGRTNGTRIKDEIGGEQLRSGKRIQQTIYRTSSKPPPLALCLVDVHLHEIRRLKGCPGSCRVAKAGKYIVLQRGARFSSL